ncbi:DUF397 domain-containing protein [Streptomyces sp. NBC_00576]|uniref:DUF397 domain-containing protein n=1 Tax=Streptomyces sp. NBC_00576 TaxID=2903665 RepID=UPI002E815DDB|nr:DUF397 domain-containing protein [Streptomyces sp. NBC_00576]WUB72536.1 DUF397 domain-containing protein [Streptomyces sp. NBC_00576]
MTPHWQKSSYCSEGDSCIHIATTPTTPRAIHLTESGDPTGAVLTTTPTAFRTLLTTLKTDTPPPKTTTPQIEVTLNQTPDTPDAPVHLRSTTAPETVVTTDRRKWHAFVLGVRAGEFDHFA